VKDNGLVGGLDDPVRTLVDAIVQQAPVAFAVYDTARRYQVISQALADVNHLPIAAHLGRRPTEVLPAPLGADVEHMVGQVFACGAAVVDRDFVADIPAWGGVRHFESRWYPVRCPAGEVIGVMVFVNDITERRASEDALRRSQARTTRLQLVTAELATALTVAEVVRIISDVGRFSIGADHSEVALLDERRRGWRPAGAEPAPPPQWPALLDLAVRESRPLYLADPTQLRAALPDVPRGQAPPGTRAGLDGDSDERAWVVLPLVASGAPLGALRFGFRRERYIDADDRVFLEALAGQCALALERARLFEREHEAAVSLQRSLLPDRLPDVPGLRIAYRYLPGAADTEVGGDWYDAFQLPDGRLAAVVGDVIGKGLTAAAGMGRVRSALRALAFTDPSPAAVLTGLDRLFTATERDESLTTLVYAVVDPGTGTVEMTDAGHLPLLVISADGSVRLHEAAPSSMPLGMAEPRTQQTVRLGRGDTLVGFSDGLVENHARGFDDGLAVLLDAARGRSAEDLDNLLGCLVRRLLVGQQRDDDVTVLALRLTSGGKE
jgi:PAS domain S-box-containing protein